jgi:signal transduction histidine kinase
VINRRFGLFRKYSTALMLLVAASLVASGLIEMALGYRSTLASTGELQRAEVRTAALRIEQYLDGIRGLVVDVGSLPWDTGLLDARDRREEFHRLLKLVPAISGIRSLDEQGREQVKVSRVELDDVNGFVKTDSEGFRQARTRGVFYGPTYFKDGTEPYMTLAVRDREPGASVTLAEINLRFVGDVVSQMPVGKAGRVYVIDSANHLVAHPNASLVLGKLDLSGYAPLRQARTELQSGLESVAGMFEADGLEGGSVMLSAAYIPTAAWLVVVEQPRSAVLAPVTASIERTAVLIVVGLLAALLVSYHLARRAAEPILKMRRGAAKIAGGDLSTRIDVKTGDEVEALAHEFNRMADQLRDYTTGLERKVAEKTAELELANRHKSEFLANISHELRTPLNAIIGFSEVLKERMFGELNAKQAEYVRDIFGSGQHLLSLINDILDLAKVEAGHMELDVHEFDVRSAVDNCCTLIRERAQRQHLRLDCRVQPGVGTWSGDERKFKQILLNLLSNAVKFTPAGGEVTLGAAIVDGWLHVTVSDTGVGIAPEDQGVIFNQFQQLHGSGVAKHEGTGLGLPLSRRLVELHGGSLSVQSERGKGSTFTARFPPAPGEESHV